MSLGESFAWELRRKRLYGDLNSVWVYKKQKISLPIILTHFQHCPTFMSYIFFKFLRNYTKKLKELIWNSRELPTSFKWASKELFTSFKRALYINHRLFPRISCRTHAYQASNKLLTGFLGIYRTQIFSTIELLKSWNNFSLLKAILKSMIT